MPNGDGVLHTLVCLSPSLFSQVTRTKMSQDLQVSGEISHFISVSRLPPPPPLSPLKSWPYDGTTQSQSPGPHRHSRVDGWPSRLYGSSGRAPSKKARRDPEALEDTYATWTPVNDDGLTEAHTFADAVSSYDVVVDDDEGSKRKRYKNSDEPMSSWRPLQQEFLDALLRRSGLGNYLSETACSCCVRGVLAVRRMREVAASAQSSALFVGLTGLGMVYQLGHHGLPCEFPGVRRSMVVMNGTGIHTIDFQYCGCDTSSQTNNLGQLLDNGWYPATTIDPSTCATIECLETFRLLNVIGNITVHDYVGTLERLMDPVHVSSVPDRYKAFGRMARQYAFLQRVKRAGRGHESDGLRKTQRGGLACLVGHARTTGRTSRKAGGTSFARSWAGVFRGSGPYKEHLRHYVAEKDLLHCVRRPTKKETRLTTGLRVSGVGGCVCARHGVVRPQGLGDLQKGERYANMDWIFMAALAVALLCLTISYDIAFLPARVARPSARGAMPDRQFPELRAGGWTDRRRGYREDVGGPESGWVCHEGNGGGGRHDAIENKIDHMNFEKNVNQGKTLARKLIVAIAERDKQVAEFKDVDSTLERSLRGEWKTRSRSGSSTDPSRTHCLPGGKSAGPSEAAVLRELKEVEAADAAEGRSPLSASTSTPSAFMKAGLQLEESHGRLTGGQASYQSRVKSQIQELRMAFLRKLRTFERLQAVYMPGVAALRQAAEDARDHDQPPPKAEDIKLWLPSDLPAAPTPYAETSDHWRDSGSVGQRAATRSATLIGRVGDRISRVAAKYRGARTALIALKGPAFAPQFKELKPGDMNVNAEEESDALSRKKLGRLAAPDAHVSSPRMHVRHSLDLDSRRWAGRGPGTAARMFVESVRVEWSKARARRDRWVEEVDILREEMKRVLRFLRWIQVEWRRRAELRDIDPQLAAGLKAYALRQVAVHRRIAAGFHVGWNVSVATAVRDVVRQDGTVYRELLESEELDMAPTTEGLELGGRLITRVY
ncbi:hypothetical protein B0H13DRAFT_1915348 [Mycena leptocephala]|nr:hypothetical protein B0H13DRAFT_1915348 [Mycena leptocephala]